MRRIFIGCFGNSCPENAPMDAVSRHIHGQRIHSIPKRHSHLFWQRSGAEVEIFQRVKNCRILSADGHEALPGHGPRPVVLLQTIVFRYFPAQSTNSCHHSLASPFSLTLNSPWACFSRCPARSVQFHWRRLLSSKSSVAVNMYTRRCQLTRPEFNGS